VGPAWNDEPIARDISRPPVAFKCDKKQWVTTNITVDKFHTANGGKLIDERVYR
jgi:hypothetical protein